MNSNERELLYKLKKHKGFEILKEHMFKEMVNSISKTCSERDISYQAGRKSIFIFIDDETKKLDSLETFYLDEEINEESLICTKIQNLTKLQILKMIWDLMKLLIKR